MGEHDSDAPREGHVNRRSEPRHRSSIPASVRRDKPALALVRNISLHGALIFTRSNLTVGERLHLSLHLLDEGPGVPVEATVVRVVARPPAKDVWRYEVGVEFDEPLNDYAEAIVALEEKQRRLGIVPAPAP